MISMRAYWRGILARICRETRLLANHLAGRASRDGTEIGALRY